MLRRARDGFRGEVPADKQAELLAQAAKELAVVKRQGVVYSLYGRGVKNVLVRFHAHARPRWWCGAVICLRPPIQWSSSLHVPPAQELDAARPPASGAKPSSG